MTEFPARTIPEVAVCHHERREALSRRLEGICMSRLKRNVVALFGLLVVVSVNVADAETVTAIVDPVSAPQISMNLRTWCPLNIPGPGEPGYPPSGILTLGTTPSQFAVQRTGGTYSGQLFGNKPDRFAAFCLEPLQQVAFTEKTYELGELTSAGTDLPGGMGTQRAGMIQELFGRFYPDFRDSISQNQAAALQIATWEILREKVTSNCVVQPLSYSDLDLSDGDIFFNFAPGGVIELAQSYLDALDGSGPKAAGLAALTLAESPGQDSQDLLVQIIPEPGTVLLFSAGLIGLGLTRRNRLAK
ncbi:MAG: PEP-CTERM sorting domain-containing protein [Planctomycetaceae bacterium]